MAAGALGGVYARLDIGGRLEDDDALPPPSCWERVGKRIVGLFASLGLAASGAAVAFTHRDNPVARVAGFGSLGVGLQGAADALTPNGSMDVARRVENFFFGQLMSEFAPTLVYFGITDPDGKAACVNVILTSTGAAVTRALRTVYENAGRPITESSVRGAPATPLFSFRDGIQATIGSAFTVLWATQPDVGSRSFGSFFAPYFFANIAGKVICVYVNRKVQQADDQTDSTSLGGVQPTKWRYLKNAMDTSGMLSSLWLLVPKDGGFFSLVSGAGCGLTLGMLEGGQMERMARVPLERLEELEENSALPLKNPLYQAFEWCAPAALAALTGYAVYEVGWRLPEIYKSPIPSQVDMTLISTVTVGTFAIAHFVDRSWRPNAPLSWKDHAIRVLMMDPNIPFLAAVVGMNSVDMKSRALEANANDISYQVWTGFSWAAYSMAMALETEGAVSRRRGSAIRFPRMLIANGLIAARELI